MNCFGFFKKPAWGAIRLAMLVTLALSCCDSSVFGKGVANQESSNAITGFTFQETGDCTVVIATSAGYNGTFSLSVLVPSFTDFPANQTPLDRSSLTPIVTHNGTLVPPDRTARDFSVPVRFTVSGNKSPDRIYVVTVEPRPEILEFSCEEDLFDITIHIEGGDPQVIIVEVTPGTDITALTAVITYAGNWLMRLKDDGGVVLFSSEDDGNVIHDGPVDFSVPVYYLAGQGLHERAYEVHVLE
jgi:hypothetical protein